jgi:hypothetical protein
MERLGLFLDDHPGAATRLLPQAKDKEGAKKVRIKKEEVRFRILLRQRLQRSRQVTGDE